MFGFQMFRTKAIAQPLENFFLTCGPNGTQVCSHVIGYIPVPIGRLFAIAPAHDLNGNGATQTCPLEN